MNLEAYKVPQLNKPEPDDDFILADEDEFPMYEFHAMFILGMQLEPCQIQI